LPDAKFLAHSEKGASMAVKKSGLGRGLDALIPGSDALPAAPVSGAALLVAIDEIIPNPRQPRSRFEPEALQELSDSIREHGVIQPLIVSRNESGSGYTLIAGERRLQASRLAGLAQGPVIVRQTTDQQKLELALIENIQRADLNALEEALAYQQLSDEFRLSHEEIARHVGKSRVAVTNTLRLLKLPANIQQVLVDRRITEGHARALLALANPQAQNAALQTVLTQNLTVRQTEELVRKMSGEKPPARLPAAPTPDVQALEERLRNSLGTKVSLKSGKKGNGSLTLFFYSAEELDAILAHFLEKE